MLGKGSVKWMTEMFHLYVLSTFSNNCGFRFAMSAGVKLPDCDFNHYYYNL